MFERTFFITTGGYARKPVFRFQRVAELLIDAMYRYRNKGKFWLHEFVVMPDHLHLLITPGRIVSLERSMQLIKGGFSVRCPRELAIRSEIWQPGFENHRIRDERDCEAHKTYIRMNPVRARLARVPSEYAYSSANCRFELDLPTAAKAGDHRR